MIETVCSSKTEGMVVKTQSQECKDDAPSTPTLQYTSFHKEKTHQWEKNFTHIRDGLHYFVICV